MKITKPGSLPEEQVFDATCTHCRCEFEFTRREARYESTCRNEEYLIIHCPTCKREVYRQI